MLFFTSDTHLGHHNIIKYCDRPFKNVEEMNETIIKNWNSVVQPTDIVFHLGDVAFRNESLKLVNRLNGTKWLVRGNHDRGYSDTKFRNVGFEEIFCKPYSFVRFQDCRPILIQCMHAPNYFRKDHMNLCGHVHEKWVHSKGYLNVGVDAWKFTPVSLPEIIKQYSELFPDIYFSRYLSRSFEQFSR